MREIFISRRLQPKIAAIIARANTIIEEFVSQGYVLTVRQIFYQFVGRDWIVNTKQDYKNLQAHLKNARNAGVIDWDAIEDRSRVAHVLAVWTRPADIIAAAAQQYREDVWRTQRFRPEVWIEKDALVGVIAATCDQFRVPYFAHRGNDSTGDLYRAGKRFQRIVSQGQVPLVLHLADHDPNGLDMTRDIRTRLALYTGTEVEVRRLALNIAQVRRHRLPHNFAKEADIRYAAYMHEFGRHCWELDALSPTVLNQLIRTELEKLIDQRQWKKALAAEARGRKALTAIAKR